MFKCKLYVLPLLLITSSFLLSCDEDESDSEQYRTNHVTEAIEGIEISFNEYVYTYRGTDEPVSGKYTSYFDTGDVQADITFHNGMVQEGTIRGEDGSTYFDFVLNEENQTVEKTYDKNGTLRMNRIHGETLFDMPMVIESFREDGSPLSVFSPELIKEWYENGYVHTEANFMDGELHGRVAKWHENGQIAGESFYIRGVLDGDYLEWDESGNKITKKKYEMGKLVFNQD
ncbi:MAG: hypothetical protein JJU46_02395 [Balneolaceae bacterium]|nr:hypothetical protein [Balneolaceae bacterium]MCH8549453.1 hypothetical protein [Balneolaceae bacterium]